MNPLFGEFPCKLDAKGRFLLPAALLRQLPAEPETPAQTPAHTTAAEPSTEALQPQEFVINRGLDNCLVLYPRPVWEQELVRIMSRNQYDPDNRAFARKFQAGATPVQLDSAKRLLVPKRLAEWAGLQHELVLIGALDKVEIWAQEHYDAWMNHGSAPLEDLARRVMTKPPET
jgi:MraZ protein